MVLYRLVFAVLDVAARIQARAAQSGRERGDVPGWVLVTIMTAGIVTVLWALAGRQLQDILTQALSSVTGPGGR